MKEPNEETEEVLTDPVRKQVDDYLRSRADEKQGTTWRLIVAVAGSIFAGTFFGAGSVARSLLETRIDQQTSAIVAIAVDRARGLSETVDETIQSAAEARGQLTVALELASDAQKDAANAARSSREAVNAAEGAKRASAETQDGALRAAEAARKASESLEKAQNSADKAAERARLANESAVNASAAAGEAASKIKSTINQVEGILSDVQLQSREASISIVAALNEFDQGGETASERLVSAILESRVVQQAIEAESMALPIGTIVAWPGPIEMLPAARRERWRTCAGGSAPFNEDLWSALRGLYGNGNLKADTIQLPNFAGCFLRGAGAVDPGHSSASIGELQADQNSAHSHIFENDGSSNQSPTFAVSGLLGSKIVVGGGNSGLGLSRAKAQLSASGGSESRPINMAVHWLIRVR